MFRYLLVLLGSVFALDSAADVEISGSVSYSVEYGTGGDTVSLSVDRISNHSLSRTTGTLYLTLWMTTTANPYTEGHRAARVSLAAWDGVGRLPPNHYYGDISLDTAYEQPPPGTYYVHLFVSEYPDLNVALDLVTFTDTLTVETHSNVEFSGTVSYAIQGNSVTLAADRITNNSQSRTTGTLYLTLWMTPTADPYTEGHRAARVSLAEIDGVGRLPPNYYYYDISLPTAYQDPPDGTYYVHLYVSEQPDTHVTLDLVTFTNTLTVGDDHGDTFALATTVPVPSSTTGRIENGGDVDMFRIEIAEAGTLRVATSGNTDTYGILADTQGQTVGVDDDSGEGLNFLVSTDVQRGTWYIQVAGYDHATTGEYILGVSFEPRSSGPISLSAEQHLGDFNGDGYDDVLLRHNNGRWYVYPMNGRQPRAAEQGSANLTRDTDYRLAGIGDFDGDGSDDVLLRHIDGRWYFYPMNGRQVVAGGQGSANLTRDIAYRVAGIGDFDGDGRDDVLLRHIDGRWYLYPMNGRHVVAGGQGSANLTRDTAYRVAGIGDMDGDGRDDVLLRHIDGRWYFYPMNGRRPVAARQGTADLTRDTDYQLAGIGDFDGDGRDDVLLRHIDGRWYFYPMNGRRHLPSGRGSVNLTRDVRWRVVGFGDLDGDGRDDVLLRHADGRWYYYGMNGRYRTADSGSVALTKDLAWSIPARRRTGAIWGTLSVTGGQVLDGDTRDRNDHVVGNDAPSAAQSIPLPASVAGFADRVDDPDDNYRLYLPAPTRISLAIADAGDADLDLYLSDAEGTIVANSLGVDDLEAIRTTRTGEHVVTVRAYSGGSNYSLVLGIDETPTASSEAGASANTWSRDGDFSPTELIVELRQRNEWERPHDRIRELAGEQGFDVAHESATGGVLVRVQQQGLLDALYGDTPTGLRYDDDALRRRATTLLMRKRLIANGDFELVQPNYIYRSTALPDDPFYVHQWHYPQIGLPQAWDLTTGNERVVTAVIDTGIVWDHPDIESKVLRNGDGGIVGFDFISDPANARDGDGIDGDPYDTGDAGVAGRSSTFHGTHVAGTVGAATNNGIGVSGVDWRGKIMPIRVLGVGGGTTRDIAEGIRYGAGLANASGTVPPVRADVMNLSLGRPNERCLPVPPVDQTTAAALQDAMAAGVIVVVAAGNDNCREPAPMSTVEGVISVSAVDHFGRAPYSNFGPTVDVAAPGGNTETDRDGDGYPDGVLSVEANDTHAPVQHEYGFLEGTSMAAPHVAGVVALMLAVNPDLTADDVNALLAGTHGDPGAAPITRDWGPPGRDDAFGHGLIDAGKAVTVAQRISGGGAGTPTDPVLSVSPTSLYFGAVAGVLRMRLSNVGGGLLTVQSVQTDAHWLSIRYEEWPTLVVRVDRNGLDQRTFVGHITIESDGGNLTVPVAMQVHDSPLDPDVGTAYVLALDPDNYTTRAHAITNVGNGYRFRMPDVLPGRYLVAAGTDRDGDGYICDPGEACGMWPLLDGPAVVEVDGDQQTDFGVSIDLFARVSSQAFRSEKVSAKGFAILPAKHASVPNPRQGQ